MMLMTGSALYGFSTGASCAIPDVEYQYVFVPGSGMLFNTEDNNGEYLCFKIQDHVGNTVYAASVNPLNIDVSGPTVPVITNVDGDLFNPFYTNDANTPILITSESGSTLTVSGWACTPTPVNGSGQVSCIPNVSLTE